MSGYYVVRVSYANLPAAIVWTSQGTTDTARAAAERIAARHNAAGGSARVELVKG